MEKKESTTSSSTTTTSSPMGMCEKLFNALHISRPTAFRPIRRLTFRQPEPTPNSPPSAPSPPLSRIPSNTTKDPSPPKTPLPLPPKQEPTPLPQPVPPPLAAPAQLDKAPSTKVQLAPLPPPPEKKEVSPSNAAQAAVPVPAPPPKKALPVPKAPPKEAPARMQTRNINDKSTDYITRARGKIRTTSGVGAGAAKRTTT